MSGHRLSIYLPHEVMDDIEEFRGSETVSRFIRGAVEERVKPLRPHCSECRILVRKSWRFCPACGSKQRSEALSIAGTA